MLHVPHFEAAYSITRQSVCCCYICWYHEYHMTFIYPKRLQHMRMPYCDHGNNRYDGNKHCVMIEVVPVKRTSVLVTHHTQTGL